MASGPSRPTRPRPQRGLLTKSEVFDKSFDILDAYRIATENDHTGAVMFGDEMIDEASAQDIANSFVARGARQE